jgi:tetratricopeptide (TPR) repeat protein
MTDHPSSGEFESFLRGISSPEASREIVRHLLASCSSCRGLLKSRGWTRDRLDRLISPLTTLGVTHEEGDAGIQTPEDLALYADELAPEPKVVELLLDRSHAARYNDSREMIRYARLARAMAERCDAWSAGGQAQLADLRARAWGQLGNALRVAGRLNQASKALRRARTYCDNGTGDRLLAVRLLNWKGCLYTFQRRFADAIVLLDEAIEISQDLGDRLELAKTLVNKGIAAVYSGDPDTAIGVLDRAIPLIGSADSHLLFAAHHDLIVCYLEAGRLKEALALVPRARSIGEAIDDELFLLRVLWQEGRILCELGLLEEAESQFARAREGFIEHDLAYPAALVSLDLTAVYVKLGLAAEVRRTIADILPIFSSLQISRELLASVIRLQQTESQHQALELIRSVSWQLRAGPKLHPSD